MFRRSIIIWVNKDTMHLPRSLGGLGIRCLSSLNKAMLMKQVWRLFTNPQLLVSTVFEARTTFLSNNSLSRPRFSGHHSYGLRGLLKADSLLRQGCHWKIGNGRSTLTGSASWVNGSIPEFKPGIPLQNTTDLTVSFFIHPHTLGWDNAKVTDWFAPSDASTILVMEGPDTTQEDFCYCPEPRRGGTR